MSHILTKQPSPQAAAIYQLLQNGKTMSAKEIGKHLRIFPNAVYREIKQLQNLGFVEETYSYPVKFRAKPGAEAMAFYISMIRQNFYQMFGETVAGDQNLKLDFFQTRDDLLKLSIKDMQRSKRCVNLIISGHEVSAEVMLSQKQAVERGVKMRKLIQGLSKENLHMAKIWQKMGIEVRYTPNLNARIVTYDGLIVHFGSYDAKNHLKSVGVRFVYAPFAKLIDDMFEQKWLRAKKI